MRGWGRIYVICRSKWQKVCCSGEGISTHDCLSSRLPYKKFPALTEVSKSSALCTNEGVLGPSDKRLAADIRPSVVTQTFKYRASGLPNKAFRAVSISNSSCWGKQFWNLRQYARPRTHEVYQSKWFAYSSVVTQTGGRGTSCGKYPITAANACNRTDS